MAFTFCLFPVLDGIAKYVIEDFHVVQIVWGRLFFQTVVVIGCLLAMRRLRLARATRPGLLVAVVSASWLANFPIIASLAYLPLADAFAIALTTPLMVTALSATLLAEPVGRRRWAAVWIGFGGAMLIMRPGLAIFHWASLLPLLSAALFALYQIGVRRLSAEDEPLTILTYASVLPLLATTVFLPWVWIPPEPVAWGLLASIGVGAGAAHLVLIHALRLAPASLLAPIMYVSLISSTVFGLLVFGDFPDAPTIAGALVIAASGVYVARAGDAPRS